MKRTYSLFPAVRILASGVGQMGSDSHQIRRAKKGGALSFPKANSARLDDQKVAAKLLDGDSPKRDSQRLIQLFGSSFVRKTRDHNPRMGADRESKDVAEAEIGGENNQARAFA
ncbi:MAG: hypothetical protein WEB59_06490 [Thermoanaerobaculia bacterium]